MKERLSPPVKKDTMAYITAGIAYVCRMFKSRAPGTQSERDAQDYFAKELDQWADEVTVEEFKVHPAAFMGFIPIAALFGVAGSVLFFLNRFGPSFRMTLAVLILVLIALLMFIFQFVLYRRFVDFLFPAAVSKNVYAVRKPSGETKRRIIFGGHADAAWEWTYSLYGQIKTLAPVIFGSIIGLFFSVIFVPAYLIAGTPEIKGFWAVISILFLAFVPFYLAMIAFTNWRVVVDGANDNLSACYASMAVLKEMAENDMRFENTEVCCLITGSEEAGLRGAKAFCKKHAADLKKEDTVFVALETLRECAQLAVYNRDETGTVHNNECAADLLIAAGERLGMKLPRAPIYPGSTDAAAFTQAGLRAIGLGGVDHNPQKYYHTRFDTCDNISPECIERAIDIAFEAACIFDAEGC